MQLVLLFALLKVKPSVHNAKKNVLFFSFVSSQRGNDQTGKTKEKNVRK